jgi:crotonobetainyl-CoA:carnitine CoA-transferase CaiB-like acyl-CoA transferase
MAGQPLEGMTVIEWCSLVAGPFCGKWLAEAGATVIKIEQPGDGDEARRYGPFPNDEPDSERSGLYLSLNTNKLGTTLDPTAEEGREALFELVRRADVLLEDQPPPLARERGLTPEVFLAANPRLVVTSITAFGQDGPDAGLPAHPLNVVHASGATYHQLAGRLALQQLPDGGPVKPGSFLAECDAGLQAAVATMAALLARETTGRGQHVDISRQWAMASTQRPEISRYANDGAVMDRELNTLWLAGVYECTDGYITIGAIVGERGWRSAAEMLGHPAWASEPWFEELWTQQQMGIRRPPNVEVVAASIAEFCRTRTRDEVTEAGQALNLTIGQVRSIEEVLTNEHMRARGFLRDLEHPRAGTLPFTGFPFLSSALENRRGGPAPALGQHNDEVFRGLLGYDEARMGRLRGSGAS